ncbi:MAG: hypothetical protein ACO34E_03765 [Limisphaerales bacterium]
MTTYRGRRAESIESDVLRVTVLVEGGHVAEILHKPTGVNPLWQPPWATMEPSAYDPEKHPEYGLNSESRLLAGLMGHNLCLDLFGSPSAGEAAAGMTVHGEASLLPYEVGVEGGVLVQSLELPQSRLRFRRRLGFSGGQELFFEEEVENLSAFDRPIAWTQHVTLGEGFVVPGRTQFRVSATRSKVYESDFLDGRGYMEVGAEFDWPEVPRVGGGVVDMRTALDAEVSGGFTTHLMDPGREESYFMAWNPDSGILIGYVWRREDFPWMGMWEENRCRTIPPWNGVTVARGMEFGVSPMPESRRKMIERGSLFWVPSYRWVGAGEALRVRYRAFVGQVGEIPERPAF